MEEVDLLNYPPPAPPWGGSIVSVGVLTLSHHTPFGGLTRVNKKTIDVVRKTYITCVLVIEYTCIMTCNRVCWPLSQRVSHYCVCRD